MSKILSGYKHETWLTADQAKEKKLIDKVMFEEKETNLQLVAGPMFKLPDQTKMNAARKMMESGEEVPDKVALQKLKLLKLKGEKR